MVKPIPKKADLSEEAYDEPTYKQMFEACQSIMVDKFRQYRDETELLRAERDEAVKQVRRAERLANFLENSAEQALEKVDDPELEEDLVQAANTEATMARHIRMALEGMWPDGTEMSD